MLGAASQLPVVWLSTLGAVQVFSPQEPSAFTSFRTDLQVAQVPSAFEVAQRSDTQTTPTRVEPDEQVGGMTQLPEVRLYLVLGQEVQSPERALKVLQFLAGSTLLQVPLKNWVSPQPWAWMTYCWWMLIGPPKTVEPVQGLKAQRTSLKAGS